MTATVLFETASLSGAIGNAARVAPVKGPAFDKVPGIHIDVDEHADKPVTVRATNMEIDYLQWVEPVEVTGKASWRLPSALLDGFVSNLPVTSGSRVKFTAESDQVKITSGSTRAKLNTIVAAATFTPWESVEADALTLVEGFGARVSQVAWATARQGAPYTGIHINGTHLVATDRYRLAMVPLVVPVPRPITVPLDVIRPILRTVTDAWLAVGDTVLWLVPDDSTQIRSVIFAGEYPAVTAHVRREYPHTVQISRVDLATVLNRMLVMVRTERYPLLKLTLDGKKIVLFMDTPGVGEVTDEVAVQGGTKHKPCVIQLTPTYLLDALSGTEKADITLGYDAEKPTSAFRITDGDGYEAWVMPRVTRD